MASTFFGLNIATSGISASQAGLTTTAHNISNENTKGYSRQQINQTAADAIRFYTSYGMMGAGVQITGIEQVRDKYYDVKYRNNEAKLGEFSSKYSYTIQIEDYLNEIETDGFTAEYENLFSTLSSLQGNPEELTYRTEFLNYCQSIADYFNEIQTKLTDLQMQTNTEVSNMVERITKISQQIASLTKQINSVELTGAAANDLRDKRELLVDELSTIIPISTSEVMGKNGNSEFYVKMQGLTLVDTYDSFTFDIIEREKTQSSMDCPGIYDVYYQGSKVDMEAMKLTGALKATIDIRDGNNGETEDGNPLSKPIKYKGIPYYVNQIQKFKETLAKEFNDIHQNATRVDENGNTVPANYNLYGDTTEDIPIFIISNNGVMSVNLDLMKDPSLLAGSSYPIQNGVADSGLFKLLSEVEDKKIFDNFSAEEYLQSLVAEVAIDVKKANTFEVNYTNIKKNIENQRMSVSGVDGDEEAMNLVKFQEAFELSAKMISVMQQIYDKLINEMGV